MLMAYPMRLVDGRAVIMRLTGSLTPALAAVVSRTCAAAPVALYLLRTIQMLPDPLENEVSLREYLATVPEPDSPAGKMPLRGIQPVHSGTEEAGDSRGFP